MCMVAGAAMRPNKKQTFPGLILFSRCFSPWKEYCSTWIPRVRKPCTSKRWGNHKLEICQVWNHLLKNVNMPQKSRYNCSVSRLARGTPPAYPYISLFDIEIYRIHPHTNEFPEFFSWHWWFFCSPFCFHVCWSNPPFLLNYTYLHTSPVLPPHDFGSNLLVPLFSLQRLQPPSVS